MIQKVHYAFNVNCDKLSEITHSWDILKTHRRVRQIISRIAGFDLLAWQVQVGF